MIRAAFLGIRHPHVLVRLELLRAAADVEVAGFHEPDAALAERFAAATGLHRFASVDEALDAGLDLAVVEGLDTEVPDVALHAAPRVRALLLEKPGAPTLPEMDRLVAGLTALPVDVTVGYELHFAPAVVRARELVATGVLGHVTAVRAHGGCPNGCGDELWQSVPGDLGGVLFTEGCHLLEILLDLFGAPDGVIGTVARLEGGTEVRSDVVKRDLLDPPAPGDVTRVGGLMYEDVGAALLRYPDKLVTLDVTAWEAGDWVELWRIDLVGTHGTLSLFPLPGRVELDVRTPGAGFAVGRTAEEWEHPEGEPTLTVDAAYEDEMTAILDRLRAGAPPEQESLRLAHDVVRVLDAAYRSAAAPATALH
ncbi:Gfo/Idh/MocA family oxidoreductase [Patulibacter sp. SYSU D01012]|uniref:Gfo/Idh/MocA family protein n=1 Tax=Patulibacter sp. SYSU D01012 TaxID=2817381 RepID=UPI001B313DCB